MHEAGLRLRELPCRQTGRRIEHRVADVKTGGIGNLRGKTGFLQCLFQAAQRQRGKISRLSPGNHRLLFRPKAVIVRDPPVHQVYGNALQADPAPPAGLPHTNHGIRAVLPDQRFQHSGGRTEADRQAVTDDFSAFRCFYAPHGFPGRVDVFLIKRLKAGQ